MSARPLRRSVKVKTLLAATAGAAVVTIAACGGPFTSGNLIAPPDCGVDAGPPGCITQEPVDSGTDGGTGGDQ